MKKPRDTFLRFEDPTGEIYYCPLETARAGRIASERVAEDCVEASTAGRYAGNIHVVTRFSA